MFLSAVLMMVLGQCEPAPACVAEKQVVLNIKEQNRYYVGADLNGYHTEIPVINGLLPLITKFHRGQIVELVLDYGCGFKSSVAPGGRIRYTDAEPCSQRTTAKVETQNAPQKDIPKRTLGVPTNKP